MMKLEMILYHRATEGAELRDLFHAVLNIISKNHHFSLSASLR
jgi:hypothetical protein